MSRRNAKRKADLPRVVVNGRPVNRAQAAMLKRASEHEARRAALMEITQGKDGRPLTADERRQVDDANRLARVIHLQLERQIGEASARLWLADAMAEAVDLAKERGEVVEISDKAEHKGRVRIKSRDGLEILRDAKRLNAAQFAAGERYREKYEAGRMETMPTSRYGARGGGSSDPEAASARRAHASAMVREWDNLARDHVAAIPGHKPCHAHDALFALHAVAGKGETINAISTSGGRRAALTERLVEALDVLADEMGLQ